MVKWFKIIIPKVSNQTNIFEKLAAKILLFFDICKKECIFLAFFFKNTENMLVCRLSFENQEPRTQNREPRH